MPGRRFPDLHAPDAGAAIGRAARERMADVARTVAEGRRRGRSDIDILIEETRKACAGFDARVATLEPRPIACGKGCAGCCYQSVGASFGEVLALADFVRRERPDLIPGLEAAAAEVRRLRTGRERFRAAMPCAFLAEDLSCAVYPARPMACRAANSPDAGLCGPLNDPAGTHVIPQHGATRDAAVEAMLDLTLLNNVVTGRPRTGEMLNGAVCALAALETGSLAAFDDWFAHAEAGDGDADARAFHGQIDPF